MLYAGICFIESRADKIAGLRKNFFHPVAQAVEVHDDRKNLVPVRREKGVHMSPGGHGTVNGN